MPRAIRITSASGALTVNLTGPSGATPTVYTDSAFTTTTSLPATVTSGGTSTFWLQSPGAYSLSVKTSTGTEIASDNNSPRTVDLETSGTIAALTYDTRFTHRIEGDSGRGSDTGDTNAAYPTVQAVPAATGVAATDTANIQAALTAVGSAGGGTVYLPKGNYKINAALPIPSNTKIQGAGRGATVLTKAIDATDIFTNVDPTGGNVNITIEQLTVDGDKANRGLSDTNYLLNLVRCSYLTIRDIELKNANGPGGFITGNGTVTGPAFLSNIYVHDHFRYGLWVGFSMRRTTYHGISVENNGQEGLVVDHSEANVNGVYAKNNGIWGIWIRNVFGSSFSNLVATQNGQHGIYAEGLVGGCVGTNWRAQNNGTSGAGYSDIFLSGGNTAVPNYGTTQYLTLAGIACGYDGGYVTGSRTEDYGLYLDDALSEVKIFGAHYAGSGNLGDIRLPASPGNLVVLDATAATAHLRQSAGDYFNKPSYSRLLGVATGSRPAASTAGKGAQHYDTTLNKPIWSDGTNWKDASGTTV